MEQSNGKTAARGKATRYYIDEFHLLLKEEQTAAYSVEIWKRFSQVGRYSDRYHAERQRPFDEQRSFKRF